MVYGKVDSRINHCAAVIRLRYRQESFRKKTVLLGIATTDGHSPQKIQGDDTCDVLWRTFLQRMRSRVQRGAAKLLDQFVAAVSPIRTDSCASLGSASIKATISSTRFVNP
jgi:hypothetical protein